MRAGYHKRLLRRVTCPACGELMRQGVPCYTCQARKVKQMCIRCLTKYRQHASGLCRSCERGSGAVVATTYEQDQARTERHERVIASMQSSLLASAFAKTDRRTVIVDGRAYEVVWDGTMDGPKGIRIPVQ